MPHLRPAHPDDATDLAAVAAAAYARYVPRIGRPPAPMLADYGQVLATAEVWVADDDGRPVGFAVLTEHPGHLLLENVAVHPDHQGQGIGSALVAAVLVTADLGGEPSVVLLGDPGWYAHFGFQTAADHGIGSPGPWADRFFQVRPLQAWHPGLAGAFRYAPAFDLDS